MYLCITILTYTIVHFLHLQCYFWPRRPTNTLVEFIIFLGGDASGRIVLNFLMYVPSAKNEYIFQKYLDI